jgi:hypothetical protein
VCGGKNKTKLQDQVRKEIEIRKMEIYTTDRNEGKENWNKEGER